LLQSWCRLLWIQMAKPKQTPLWFPRDFPRVHRGRIPVPLDRNTPDSTSPRSRKLWGVGSSDALGAASRALVLVAPPDGLAWVGQPDECARF